MSDPTLPEYFTLPEAATRYRTSQKTLRRAIATGELPAYRLGKRGNFRIRADDLDKLLVPVRVVKADA